VRILAVPAMSPDLVLGSVGEPGALAFSPDNRLLAVGSGPDVALFDVSSGQRVTTLRGSVGAVRQITWSTQANRVWALTADGHVAGWRWRAGRLLVNDPAQWFVALAGPDQHGRVAAVNRNGSFYLVDTSAQSVSAARHTDLPTVLSAAMTRQTGVLAVGSPNTVALLDLDHDSQRRMPLPDCTPTGLAFAADGKRLYVACGGGQVREYSIADGSLIHSTSAAGLAAYSVATDDAGDVIVGDEFGHVVQVGRNLDQASVLHGDNCAGVIRAVSLDPSGKWLESAGDGASHVGCLFEAHHGATGWTWNANIQQADIGEQARAIAIEPGGATALIGFSDGTVRFWQTGSLDASGVYHDFGGEVRGLVPSADGSQLVIATGTAYSRWPPVVHCVTRPVTWPRWRPSASTVHGKWGSPNADRGTWNWAHARVPAVVTSARSSAAVLVSSPSAKACPAAGLHRTRRPDDRLPSITCRRSPCVSAVLLSS